MNFKTAVLSLAIASASFATFGASAAQILVNPGFESGNTSGWTVSGAGLTNDAAHTGSFSFGAMGADYVSQTFAPVSVASITGFSFWGKRTGGLFDGLVFNYADGTQTDTFVNLIGRSDDWLFVDLLPLLNNSKMLTSFRVYGTSPGPAYLDDFSLTTADAAGVPEPATMLLLGLGMLGIAGSRKRHA